MRIAIALSIAAIAAFANAGTANAADPYGYNGIQRRYQPRIQKRIVYKFGAKAHLDTLVVRLHDQANAVCWEMYLNHRHEAGYRTTYAEMYKVLQDLKHIHELAHDDAVHVHGPGNEDHIAHDLHDIDKLFHHIQEDIVNWGVRNHWDHNPYHRHGSRLDINMELFEQALHHLMQDYGVTSRIGIKKGAPPVPKNQGPPVPVNSVPQDNAPFRSDPVNSVPNNVLPGNNGPLDGQPLLP